MKSQSIENPTAASEQGQRPNPPPAAAPPPAPAPAPGPAPVLPPALTVIAALSPSASIDCHREDAYLDELIMNASLQVSFCREWTTPEGLSYKCDSGFKFLNLPNAWTYDPPNRQWTRPRIFLRNQSELVPGIYRDMVRTSDGKIFSSDHYTIRGAHPKNCTDPAPAPTPPTPTPTPPAPGPTPAPPAPPAPTPGAVDPVTGAPLDGLDPSRDPGLGQGSWIPKGTKLFLVADSSSEPNYPGVSQLPGCINGGIPNTDCYSRPDYNGFHMSGGSVLSIRYRLPDPPKYQDTKRHYFRLSSGIGSGVPARLQFSVSKRPGDFSDNRCARVQTSGGQPYLFVLYPNLVPIPQEPNCPLNPGDKVYVNIKVLQDCARCTFKLDASAATN